MNDTKLLSFRATRRAIGLAVFSGLTLECTFVRELSAEARTARTSTRGFVRWALDTFPRDRIVVEEEQTAPGSRASDLRQAVLEEVSTATSSVSSAHPADVLAVVDRPAHLPRQLLRMMAVHLWPELLTRPRSPVALDAAVLGLFHQTNAILSSNLEQSGKPS